MRIVDRIRAIQVLPAPWDLPFPHARPALLIERHTRDPHGNHSTSPAERSSGNRLATDADHGQSANRKAPVPSQVDHMT